MTYFLTILEKTIRFTLEYITEMLIVLAFILCMVFLISLIATGEFSDKFIPPWEKEERKKAKAEAKRKKLEEKERIKFWQG